MRPLILLVACVLAVTAGEVKRPNIVVFFSDDHTTQAVSAYGDSRKLLKTPGIDRIASEGMRFGRCLVTNSICGPSRATLITGTYAHVNGFWNNTNCTFDGSQATFPKLLQAAGYQTALIGKWHLGSDPTGFDHWQILPGQGIYYNPPMIRNGEKIKVDGYVSEIITDETVKWLEARDRTKPFLLMCQHKAPHREWEPALKHLGFDNDRVYDEPPTLFDDYANRGPGVKDQDMSIEVTMTERDLKLVPPKSLTSEQRKVWDAYYEPRNALFKAQNLSGKALTRWKYQRYLHDYLACVRSVDESVASVLEALDREQLADDTIVIYASDQGFFLGEHGWFDKRWIFEESLRTPFLVRWPGVVRAGSVNDRIVSLLDVAQTLLEAAGIPAPERMQGRSLVPLLKGQAPADWRTAFYYQYVEFPTPHRVRPHEGVVTDRYKLVRYFGVEAEHYDLFDRTSDPMELRSVYGDPAYQAARDLLMGDLARLREELRVPTDLPPTVFGNRPLK
jgi:arylsulfatase A-like enzyme